MKTKEKIKIRALELFNENGIEYVGVRELAADMGMRVSNVTYYFPTKDHLVNELSKDLRDLNSNTFFELPNPTLYSFLEMLKATFYNQLKYRCLGLSFVHLITQNPMVAERYKSTAKKRFSTIELNLKNLSKNGHLNNLSDEDMLMLGSHIGIISRFWISECVISFKETTAPKQIQHYLRLVAHTLQPYSTVKGKAAVRDFFEE